MRFKREDFIEYLSKIAHIRNKEIPYYIRRVEDFLRQHSVKSEERYKKLDEYKMELSHNLEDWQVAQAIDAIRHYWYFVDMMFPGKDREHRGKRISGEESIREKEEMVLLDELMEMLRLTHRSFSTE